jgi:hypothetical protein
LEIAAAKLADLLICRFEDLLIRLFADYASAAVRATSASSAKPSAS